MSTFKYYIDNKEYTPINTGDFTLDYQLEQEAGSYQYVKSLSGTVSYDSAVYDYIQKKGDCVKILFSIVETCYEGEFIIYEGYFTNRNCKYKPDKKQVEITMKQDSFYNCLKDNFEKKFNILEASDIVQVLYEERLNYDFQFTILRPLAFYELVNVSGIPSIPYLSALLHVRELKTVYCQGGEPQQPIGTGWKILYNLCESKNLATYYRQPTIFNSPLLPPDAFQETFCSPVPCITPPPTVTALNEDWYLLDEFYNEFTMDNRSYYIDLNQIQPQEVLFNNGRLLVDVINLGLNKICPELDLQSQFLINITNPVTLNTPSSTQGIQVHAISDVKDPAATEPATNEQISLKEILESYVNAKLNCFWRVDENTRRLIIEHYNDLNNQGVLDLTAIQSGQFTKLKNEYNYDLTDTPAAEEFPSLDFAIDFTGVDINYDNDCSSGVKSYNTSKFFSEVESIYENPDEYGNDGLVMITPDSLAPKDFGSSNSARSEVGAITGDYYPNVPQGMANLHEKFWKYYRPFPQGEMNFVGTQFNKLRPDKQLEEITIPISCFFFFAPYQRFIGNNFTQGQLQSSSFNFKTGLITLQINYNE